MITDEVVAAVLEAIREPAQSGAGIDVAHESTRVLRQRFPAYTFRVFWERESFTGKNHYEMLVGVPGVGTYAFRCVPEDGVPFVIRRAYRHTETTIVSVNGRHLELSDAVALMMISGEEKIRDRFMEYLILDGEIAELGPERLAVSDEELTDALDAFRQLNGLYSAASVESWLDQRQLSQDELETRLEYQLRQVKVKELKVGTVAEQFFNDNRALLDLLLIERYSFRAEDDAHDFHAAVKGTPDADARLRAYFDARGCSPGQVIQQVRPMALTESERRALEQAQPRVLTPPHRWGNRWCCLTVLSRKAATFDPDTRTFVIDLLFRRWLEQRASQAQIEWHWGSQ